MSAHAASGLHGATLDHLAGFAATLADESRRMLLEVVGRERSIEMKPDRSFVTDMDLAIETRLRALIADAHPDHGILGEEQGGASLDAEFVWVLDPIDGTAPFIAGMPVFGTLIALMHNGRPVIGIIDQPSGDNRWTGIEGRPTLHNGLPCRTRACPGLGSAILSVCNPDFFHIGEHPALNALREATAWRIYGGACLSFGLIASGRTDIHIDTQFKMHDLAPYTPIIAGAGGVVTDWDGRPITLGSGPRILAAGDPARHRDALALVQAAMG
jgi:histidinol phosphatase-like enzyme (inositol monophosphatase family)